MGCYAVMVCEPWCASLGMFVWAPEVMIGFGRSGVILIADVSLSGQERDALKTGMWCEAGQPPGAPVVAPVLPR